MVIVGVLIDEFLDEAGDVARVLGIVLADPDFLSLGDVKPIVVLVAARQHRLAAVARGVFPPSRHACRPRSTSPGPQRTRAPRSPAWPHASAAARWKTALGSAHAVTDRGQGANTPVAIALALDHTTGSVLLAEALLSACAVSDAEDRRRLLKRMATGA
jgi:hypothetical protein